MQPAPELAVVIACYHSRGTIAACLDSLERQRGERRVETVLVESSGDRGSVRQRFPSVRVIERTERCYAGDARNLAIPTTTAPIIAFLDADCTVPED